jgi:hypothetical protein
LLGGFKDLFFIFHFIEKGCHPKPIDELHHFSRWEHCTTNQVVSSPAKKVIFGRVLYSLGIMGMGYTTPMARTRWGKPVIFAGRPI